VSTASGGDRGRLADSIESGGFVLIDGPAKRRLLGADILQTEAAAIPTDIGDGPILRSVISLLVSMSDRLRGKAGRWHVEAHQFRIEAHAGEAGQPTPEGMHRDGVDFVLVMLIGRRNTAQGVTTIADAAGAPLVSIQLSQPFEAMILDDARVRHGVSPIEPVDPAQPAIRDALVVTVAAAWG
jgi:hypothetical protein